MRTRARVVAIAVAALVGGATWQGLAGADPKDDLKPSETAGIDWQAAQKACRPTIPVEYSPDGAMTVKFAISRGCSKYSEHMGRMVLGGDIGCDEAKTGKVKILYRETVSNGTLETPAKVIEGCDHFMANATLTVPAGGPGGAATWADTWAWQRGAFPA